MQLPSGAHLKENIQYHLREKIAIWNRRLIRQLHSHTDELLYSLQLFTAVGEMGQEWLPQQREQFQEAMNLPGHFH